MKHKTKIGSIAVVAWGFAAFFPNPAINIGNSTGIQLGTFLSIICLLLFYKYIPRAHLISWCLLFAATAVSLFFTVVLARSNNLDVNFNVFIIFNLFSFTMVVAGALLPNYYSELLLGTALAIIITSMIGFYQVYSFQEGVLPFDYLYNNASFSEMSDQVTYEFVTFIKRPFGLFPEPSAMSASVAPWCIYFLMYTFGIVRVDVTSNFTKVIYVLAGFLGALVTFISLSGIAVFLAIAIFAMFVYKAYFSKNNMLFFPAMCYLSVSLAVMYFVISFVLAERIYYNLTYGASSWQLRLQSLIMPINSVYNQGDLLSLLFGLGIGNTASYMQYNYGLDAIWSVLVTFLIENGTLGFLALFFIISVVLKEILHSKCHFSHMLFASLVFVAITFTTSYYSLLPPWIVIGWSLSWNTIEPRDE